MLMMMMNFHAQSVMAMKITWMTYLKVRVLFI